MLPPGLLPSNKSYRSISSAPSSYLGNKGTDVLTTTYTNLAVPPTNVVPYPAFGAVSWRGDVGNSTFEALQSNVRRSLYEWSVCSAPTICGRIRSTTAALAEASRTRLRTPFAAPAIKRAATTTSARRLISRLFTPCRLRIISGATGSSVPSEQPDRSSRQHHCRPVELHCSRTLCDQRGRAAELCFWCAANTGRRFHIRTTGSIWLHSRFRPIRPSATSAATPSALPGFRSSTWDSRSSSA